jgi:hypothetical protein
MECSSLFIRTKITDTISMFLSTSIFKELLRFMPHHAYRTRDQHWQYQTNKAGVKKNPISKSEEKQRKRSTG